MIQERLQWWIIVSGYFTFRKTFLENTAQQMTTENLGSKIPRAAVEKEKNHGGHFQPSHCVDNAHAPLRLLLTNMKRPWRCLGVIFENYSHNNINQIKKG